MRRGRINVYKCECEQPVDFLVPGPRHKFAFQQHEARNQDAVEVSLERRGGRQRRGLAARDIDAAPVDPAPDPDGPAPATAPAPAPVRVPAPVPAPAFAIAGPEVI